LQHVAEEQDESCAAWLLLSLCPAHAHPLVSLPVCALFPFLEQHAPGLRFAISASCCSTASSSSSRPQDDMLKTCDAEDREYKDGGGNELEPASETGSSKFNLACPVTTEATLIRSTCNQQSVTRKQEGVWLRDDSHVTMIQPITRLSHHRLMLLNFMSSHTRYSHGIALRAGSSVIRSWPVLSVA